MSCSPRGAAPRPARRALALLPVPVVFLGLDHPLEAGELLAFAEVDQRHALRRAPHFPDRFDLGADEHATGGNEHDLVVLMHQRRRDNLSVAAALLNGDHALAAAAVTGVLDDRR